MITRMRLLPVLAAACMAVLATDCGSEAAKQPPDTSLSDADATDVALLQADAVETDAQVGDACVADVRDGGAPDADAASGDQMELLGDAPSVGFAHGKTPELSAKTKLVKVKHVSAISEIPKKAPASLAYRLYILDLGTGLSILVQGKKFNLLFDGGSGDDLGKLGSSEGNKSRLLSYLFAVLGPSGPAECAPGGDGWAGYAGDKKVKIHHLFLSHAHLDHGNHLADVVRCYDVVNIWETGAVNSTEFYLDFLKTVAAETGMTYHTVAGPTADRTIKVLDQAVTIPAKIKWVAFGEGTKVALDEAAALAVLYANADKHADMNQNSMVLRLDLGAISAILAGDAESGPRKDPSAPPGDIEALLLDLHVREIDADILQVGHHGSLSANRLAFLQAVSPIWALIAVGPKKYSGVTLPDKAVVDAIASVNAKISRTDLNDAKCPVADRIGMENDSPGGCDAYVMEISAFKPKPPSGTAEAEFYASCALRCGDVSAKGCKCDAGCLARNDCCPDVCDQCVSMPQCSSAPASKFAGLSDGCERRCGDTSLMGSCGCGDGCAAAGDCCLDLCLRCPSHPACTPDQEDDPFE